MEGGIEALWEGARDRVEEELPEGFAEPFIPLAREDREFLEGGTVEVRGPFGGGSIDFLEAPVGVLVLGEFVDVV